MFELIAMLFIVHRLRYCRAMDKNNLLPEKDSADLLHERSLSRFRGTACVIDLGTTADRWRHRLF